VVQVRAKLRCPPTVTRCIDDTHFVVASVPAALARMVAPAEPVVATASVIGVRLTEDASLLLRRGDLVLGIDGTPVRSVREFEETAARPRTRAAVAIRRDGADLVLVLTQAE
jgi:hypothetical protein